MHAFVIQEIYKKHKMFVTISNVKKNEWKQSNLKTLQKAHGGTNTWVKLKEQWMENITSNCMQGISKHNMPHPAYACGRFGLFEHI